jgi:hypothetical protein
VCVLELYKMLLYVNVRRRDWVVCWRLTLEICADEKERMIKKMKLKLV